MRIEDLSHRGLMKLCCAQNELIIKLLTVQRFKEGTDSEQEENERNAWAKAFVNYNNQIKSIYNQDKLIKE